MLISPALEKLPTPDAASTPILGVLASGSGTNLDAIALAIEEGILDARIGVVVCNVEGAGAIDVAARHDLPLAVLLHESFAARRDFDDAVAAALGRADVEWLIMAGWMRLMGADFLAAFDGRVLNIHPSLLPSFRGMRAVEQALDAGVTLTGCTVHYVVPEVDAGPIVAQAAVPVRADDDAASLHARIQRAEHALYSRAIAAAIARRHNTHAS